MNGAVRTDLAMEAREENGEIEGVEMEQARSGSALITRVKVLSETGAQRLGKPVGTYVTIEQRDLYEREPSDAEALIRCIAQQITELMGEGTKDKSVLVIGLGNRELTPDSLGPRVASQILVSRHIRSTMPDILEGRLRAVCALSPGVMGETGMETGEVVSAVAEVVKPSCIIVVDALAARSTQRILSTVQITDAGVAPGSGVGNHRNALNAQTLGVPVIAVGVPMVVHAATILRDALQRLAGEDVQIDHLLRTMNGTELVVTPVVIDEAVRSVAALVAQAINIALQPQLSPEEIRLMSI